MGKSTSKFKKICRVSLLTLYFWINHIYTCLFLEFVEEDVKNTVNESQGEAIPKKIFPIIPLSLIASLLLVLLVDRVIFDSHGDLNPSSHKKSENYSQNLSKIEEENSIELQVLSNDLSNPLVPDFQPVSTPTSNQVRLPSNHFRNQKKKFQYTISTSMPC